MGCSNRGKRLYTTFWAAAVTNQGMDLNDDRALVHAFLADRRETSFRALYHQHTPVLFRMAYRLLGTEARDEAEDLVQETWVRAVGRLSRFEWRSSLRTWLIGILINCAREAGRRRLERAGEPPEDSARLHDSGIDLEEAIARLAEGARAVFCLHDIEGYTHEEIGELLGITAGTSKSQLFAARRRLRSYLGEEP